MNIALIIRIIGLVCWLWHTNHHTKVADSYDTEGGRWCEKWMCRQCGKTWEYNR